MTRSSAALVGDLWARVLNHFSFNNNRNLSPNPEILCFGLK
jgi:hypothetical protein